jgi:hypothetical protein
VRYNRQEAVTRPYAPPSLISLLAGDLSGPPNFIKVDLDAPFFRAIEIDVDAPVDFGRIGLFAADLDLEYGNPSKPAELKRKSLRFAKGGPTQAHHAFFLNQKLDLDYRKQVQYHFDPLSGWEGRALSYEMPPEATLDRTLLVNPFDHFGFVELTVIPGDLDRGMIRHTEARLRYDGGTWSKDMTFTVRPDSPPQTWRLRIDDPERRDFTVALRHQLADGSVRDVPETTQRATTVTVNDPFENPLIVEFFPNFDPTNIELLLVDVTYEDAANRYTREERLEFRGPTLQSQRLRLARYDESRDDFTFRLTKLAKDHSVTRLPPVTVAESVVFLGEHLRP